MKISIINGPNLNMLGIREPHIYGRETYPELCKKIEKYALQKNIAVQIFQSNCEGEIVLKIQNAYFDKFDAIIINAAAYTHTSIAIADTIRAITTPVIEVHISNTFKRESYRHHSYLSEVCKGCIIGFGLDSYRLAVEALR